MQFIWHNSKQNYQLWMVELEEPLCQLCCLRCRSHNSQSHLDMDFLSKRIWSRFKNNHFQGDVNTINALQRTKKHSSRMRTIRLLTSGPKVLFRGRCCRGWGHGMCCHRGGAVLRKVLAWGKVWSITGSNIIATPFSSPCEQTDRCKNITFP